MEVRPFLLIIVSLLFFLNVNAQTLKADSCVYQFVENGSMINFSKLINFKKLIDSNEKKEFYIALIKIEMGNERNTKIIECSNIDEKKIILFDGSVSEFNFQTLKIDTTLLFNRIGDKKTVTYQVYNKGGSSFHANTTIIIFKLYKNIILGYSIDGCDLLTGIRDIAKKYFIFNDKIYENIFFSILNLSK
jgi:hypothetical protein